MNTDFKSYRPDNLVMLDGEEVVVVQSVKGNLVELGDYPGKYYPMSRITPIPLTIRTANKYIQLDHYYESSSGDVSWLAFVIDTHFGGKLRYRVQSKVSFKDWPLHALQNHIADYAAAALQLSREQLEAARQERGYVSAYDGLPIPTPTTQLPQ